MSTQRPTVEQIAKVLGEPVGFDISETASKLRRNLLLVSVIVMILIFGGVQAGSDVSLFGIKLTGVTSQKLMIGLAVVLIYHLVHYLWYCYELYSEWAIRLTGTRLSFVTGALSGSEGADYPSNPKQSTLYTWWLQQARSMDAYETLLLRVTECVQSLDSHIDQVQRTDMTAPGTVLVNINALNQTLIEVRQSVSAAENTIASARIPESLGRFDKRFKLLLKSQNLRILLVEVGMPVLLAVIAFIHLAKFLLLA